MFPVTHYDLVVILAVMFGFGVISVVFTGWLAWSAWRGTVRSQDMTRAVGRLVIQEADKIRALVSESR